MRCVVLLLLAAMHHPLYAAEAPTPAAAALAASTHPLTSWNPELAGPGADFLVRATAPARFVLSGEWHGERDTPQLAVALFRLMKRSNDFRFVVLEEDRLGVEAASAPGVRGDLGKIVELRRARPYLIGFTSDQDLRLLADLTGLTNGPEEIWGIDNAGSAAPFLEELLGFAPDAATREEVEALLSEARRMDAKRTWFPSFYYDNPGIAARLDELRRRFNAPPGSQAELLLNSIVLTARMHEGYHRMIQGDRTAWYPTYAPRFQWLKARFLERYRAAAARAPQPKVFFKFGSSHAIAGITLEFGMSTLGNFVHELALMENTQAYSVDIVSIGGHSMPEPQAWLKPLLRGGSERTPYVVDLRALRPLADALCEQVSQQDRPRLRQEIFGFDALLVQPQAAPASWTLMGPPPPVPTS